MYNVSEVSTIKLKEMVERFMLVNDWSAEFIPILLFAKQRNSSIESIYTKLKDGHKLDLKFIKGEKMLKEILPLLFVPMDFTNNKNGDKSFTLEDILDCTANTENTKYILTFINESKQNFPVYDYKEHIKASDLFYNDIVKVLMKGLFSINIGLNNKANVSLLLLYEIAKELDIREIASIDDSFWNPLLDRYNLAISSNPYKKIEIPFIKDSIDNSTILVMDNTDIEIYKDFSILDGCVTHYIKTSNKGLRKRDDADRKKINSRTVVAIFDMNQILKSFETKRELISKNSVTTMDILVKHLQNK